MAESKHPLRQIQSWMQNVIMHPGGVAAGLQADAAREHLQLEPEQIEQVISPSEALNSAQRLEIYAQAYFARLIECLRAEFPMLVRAMSEELFDQFAVDYLRRFPSQSYTLGELGRRFATYLRETQPAASIDSESDSCGSPESSGLGFLVDLADLEWQFSQVFDGPGVENVALLDAQQLHQIAPDDWPQARLQCVPCLRLARFDFPVQHYWQTLRDSTEALPPERAETFLAITRHDYVVRHIELSSPAFAVLSAILGNETIGEAINRASEFYAVENHSASLADDLRSWFELWTREGFFLSVSWE